MLTAVNEKGRRFTLQRSYQAFALRELREKTRFFCEACGRPVTLKLGERVSWHFAHKPNTKCEGENEPESPAHIEGKRALYEWLKNQGYFPVMEQFFTAIKQRADIFFSQNKSDIAIEYQCSSITPKRFAERNNGYNQLKIHPIWILGEHRLKRYGSSIYKWMQTDQMIYMQTSSNQNPYVIFFNGRTNHFTVLHHFWPLSPSSVIADHIVIPASSFEINHLFRPPLPNSDSDLKQKAWLIQKEKWRTARHPYQSRLERYVHTMCYKHGLQLACFPAYIGLPIQDDLAIANPPYLWQAWLVLQFLYSRPIGTIFKIRTIEEAFLRLIDKKIVNVRMDDAEGINIGQTLKRYLLALEQFAIIQKSNSNNYIIKKNVKWLPKNFYDLCREDQAALWRWMELEV